jgi:phosphoglycolate phosphatase
VQALLFDLDGTLIDSSQDIADSVNHALRTLGLPAKSKAEVERFVGDGVRTLLARALGSDTDPRIGAASESFRAHYSVHCADRTVLYPGVEETLEFFKDKKKAVVSNKPYEMVLKTLRHFGIEHHFGAVLGAESTARRKPDPEPLLKALETLSVPGSQALMVGDGTTDMLAGKAAGTRTCAVTYGYRGRSELSECGPDFFADRILDLKTLVV